MSICLAEFGVVCALGNNKQQVFENLKKLNNEFLQLDSELPIEEAQFVGRVSLPRSAALEHIDTRNNQLAYLAFQQIAEPLEKFAQQYGQQRIAVIIGTSTAGTFEGEIARKSMAEKGNMTDSFHYDMQEMIAPAKYVAEIAGAKGPVYSISTACSSSGKALVSAKALLEADLADVVIAGGVDSLTRLTVNGFKSLESIAETQCKPFSKERDGINIGEAAALFLVTKDNKGIQLLGVGETSDAYHMSAPSPDGDGAYRAMDLALKNAGLTGQAIDYVNLHGTGTIKNDEMEAKAMLKACGNQVFSGSTKRFTGHTLGAAGALEAGLCWLLLSDVNQNHFIPANRSDGKPDDELVKIRLSEGQFIDKIEYCLTNSFAFGGNNLSLVLGNKLDGQPNE